MKDRSSPRGNVFSFKPRADWSYDTLTQVRLSSKYTSPMVVVLGKNLQTKPGWVEVVTVSHGSHHVNAVLKYSQDYIIFALQI